MDVLAPKPQPGSKERVCHHKHQTLCVSMSVLLWHMRVVGVRVRAPHGSLLRAGQVLNQCECAVQRTTTPFEVLKRHVLLGSPC